MASSSPSVPPAATTKQQLRLAAWRHRQAAAAAIAVPVVEPVPSVTLSWTRALPPHANQKKRKKHNKTTAVAFNALLGNDTDNDDNDDDNDDDDTVAIVRTAPNGMDTTDSTSPASIAVGSAAPTTTAPAPPTTAPTPSITNENSKSNTTTNNNNTTTHTSSPPLQKRRRWDTTAASVGAVAVPAVENETTSGYNNTSHHHQQQQQQQYSIEINKHKDEEDALDRFMDQLQATAVGPPIPLFETTHPTTPFVESLSSLGSTTRTTTGTTANRIIDASGSVMRPSSFSLTPYTTAGTATSNSTTLSTSAATATKGNSGSQHQKQQQSISESFYQPADWLSDATQTDVEEDDDDEKDDDDNTEAEQAQRRALIEALKQDAVVGGAAAEEPTTVLNNNINNTASGRHSKTEVQSAKARRAERLLALEAAALQTAAAQQASLSDLGRDFYKPDEDSGVMEEATRLHQAAQEAMNPNSNNPTTALYLLAEQQLNKKKELTSVNHNEVEYLPLVKNVYRVPPALASLDNDAILNVRAKLKVRVRGHGAPAPVTTFAQTGLPLSILYQLAAQDIRTPFPIQAQCIPCILAGRDVIGIAKTGSGKTLAYALPLLRHITVQPALERNESGPMALILAPARELAVQIHSVCKRYAKPLGLLSTAVYGGAGVAEQIADLKRGTHIVTATPGRLIDILTMQSGKVLSLHRVSFVVLDEADRMFDMGFAPQITAILAAIRPDRQIVLFSATFPKTIEALARKSLKYPVEVMVGGRSVSSDNVTQYAELVEEEDKFLRLLQILGEHVEGTSKVIVFVDTQVRADSLFEHLLRNGYSTLSLHGGKEQEDRDSTLADFKRKDGPNVLVATGVAGRGLDVASCVCVVNYAAPNHLEAYVHQTGRTGRASNRGVCYTFVNSTDEAKFAPIICRALNEAGQAENIGAALKALSDDFKAKVEKGEAKYAGSGFKGKGYSYDSNEMTDAQRFAQLEKRQVLIDAGLLDPDKGDPLLQGELGTVGAKSSGSKKGLEKNEKSSGLKIPDNLTPELLALPGMKEALLRKAGIKVSTTIDQEAQESKDPSLGYPVQTGDNHWVQEFEINDYPREARWKVTQKETTSRMQDEFRTAVTLKGSYFPPGKEPSCTGEKKIYLHLEATSGTILRNAVLEIQRLLNEETLRVNVKAATSGGFVSSKYNVLG